MKIVSTTYRCSRKEAIVFVKEHCPHLEMKKEANDCIVDYIWWHEPRSKLCRAEWTREGRNSGTLIIATTDNFIT